MKLTERSESNSMTITPQIFEAFLKCPTKCWLRAKDEASPGGTYAAWVHEQNESYRADSIRRLTGDLPVAEYAVSPQVENLKSAQWRLVVDVLASAAIGAEAQFPGESRIHAVERVSAAGRGKSAQFVPVRFHFRNKLTKDDRLLLAFDALVLSKALGREVSLGKIIHGDAPATLKVKLGTLTGEVRKQVGKVAALLAGDTAPDLVLNRHCAECEFQARCRKIAVEKDDLSLLAGMSAKERQKLRNKGIFTVTQLSYTFRPRRRPKRMREKREKHHHSLKALAIREKNIHIVGRPELKIEGTPVYLDVEGLPDRDFYYLIGLRIGHGDSAVQHSLWADSVADEGKIWREFLAILETVEKPVLIHYGSYEIEFLQALNARYGNQRVCQPDSAMVLTSINLVSELHDTVYFPTFSNALKDIGAWLGFAWSDVSPLGLDSIACRDKWERTCEVRMKERLIGYNTEDCQAAGVVTGALLRLQATFQSNDAGSQPIDAVSVRSLKPPRKRFGKFTSPVEEFDGITEAAWWNYQRDRIYLRSRTRTKRAEPSADSAALRPRKTYPPNKVVKVPVPTSCPFCGGECIPRSYKRRTLQDLHIGTSGVKRWVVTYKFRSCLCSGCQKRFGLPDGFWPQSKFGRNLVAYLIFVAIELQTPLWTVWKMMVRFFGYEMPAGTLYALRNSAAEYYQDTSERILRSLVSGSLLHVDETQVSVEGKSAYVWVFANLEQVAFLYAESRDGCFLQEMLKDFKGVLVTDFYGAYDSLPCPQQKCLIHLMRDLNDTVLCNPYDEELTNLTKEFGRILKGTSENPLF
jgi:predicted RecB family nuclease